MDITTVVQRVWELAEPAVTAAGLELVDVQYRPESGRMMLRLLIDRPEGGVTLDELARTSRELGDVLEGHDAIAGRYHLECSSPGLNRPLVREPHFRRAIGERVQVRLGAPIGTRRQFKGVLEAVSAEGIRIRDSEGGLVDLPFSAIQKANTEFDFSRPARPGQRTA